MNKEKIKIIIVWIFLILLIFLFIYINYIKFFGFEINSNSIEEVPVENSSAEAIELALVDIVDNFNNLVELNENKEMDLNAILNNYSIYISYNTDTVITYEFGYSRLVLSINVKNEEENILKFNKVYEILIRAIQQRIGNDSDITNIVNKHLNENINYDGLTKEIDGDTIKYSIDITKKLIEEGSE